MERYEQGKQRHFILFSTIKPCIIIWKGGFTFVCGNTQAHRQTLYIYIYVCVCVCMSVCVSVCIERDRV